MGTYLHRQDLHTDECKEDKEEDCGSYQAIMIQMSVKYRGDVVLLAHIFINE